ncbi:MAG: hypothetical protein ACP5G1_04755, partial [Nanopusillaceae archaeon]
NNNSVTCDVWWVKLPNGVPANSNITIYMYVNFTNTNYYQLDYPYVGASYNVLGTFQYDNIGDVMNPGLMYQIYVDYVDYVGYFLLNQSNWPQVYSLPLTPGTSQNIGGYGFIYFTNWSVNMNGSLPSLGTTQNVNGSIEPYVEIYWFYNSSESTYPNPPISDPSPAGLSESNYGWIIKFIGFAEVQQSNTNISVLTDDGSNVEYSQFPAINTGFYNWTTNNPTQIIQAFHGNPGNEYNGSIPVGDWAFEYDYFEGRGGAATILWSNNQVYYYSPAFPPNGVMPL